MTDGAERSQSGRAALGSVAWLFLRLGTIGFGGPAAHLALMRNEVVGRRKWLSDKEFLDLLAAANLIPGPNSTEVAMHVGRHVAGVPGLIVAGMSFILPAFAIVLAVAVGYVRYGQTPDVRSVLGGITPVILAVIIDAFRQFASSSIVSVGTAALVTVAAAAALAGVPELTVLLAGGLAILAIRKLGPRTTGSAGIGAGLWLLASPSVPALAAETTAPAREVTLTGLTLFFLKVGSVLFGSGYVLLAFLRADLVEQWGWLTTRQLLDAIAVGQFTPGPLFTTATFIGYVIAGLPGALLATAGIFAPGFLFVGVTGPFIALMRRSSAFSAVLDGVVLASLGLMAAVTIAIGATTLTSAPRIVLCVASLAILLWKRPNTAWLVAGGGIIGWMANGL